MHLNYPVDIQQDMGLMWAILEGSSEIEMDGRMCVWIIILVIIKTHQMPLGASNAQHGNDHDSKHIAPQLFANAAPPTH